MLSLSTKDNNHTRNHICVPSNRNCYKEEEEEEEEQFKINSMKANFKKIPIYRSALNIIDYLTTLMTSQLVRIYIKNEIRMTKVDALIYYITL